MVGLLAQMRADSAGPAGEKTPRAAGRYLGSLDIGVLLITLLVFVAFLALLTNVVFPQGTRLGDIAARDASGEATSHTRGGVGILGDGLEGVDGKFVARLSDLWREVKIRPADSVAWTDAHVGHSVMNRDALQTFEYSRARIDFTTDNHLQVGQNSLVIFSSNTADPFLQRRDPAVVVMQGELSGVVNEGYGAFAVQLPSGVAVLSADEETGETANFKLSVNPDKSSTIAVHAGTAAIEVNDRKYYLSRNEALTVTDDGKTAGPRKLPGAPRVTSPDRDLVAQVRDLPATVNFEWGPVEAAQNYRLELARDRNFGEIVVDETLSETSFFHGNLATGEHFWRVSARDGWVQGPATQPRRLRVIRDREAPTLELSPLQQVARGEYELRGKTSPDASVYVGGKRIETSADGTFNHRFTAAPGAQAIVVEALDSVGNIAAKSQILYENIAARPKVSYGNMVAARSD